MYSACKARTIHATVAINSIKTMKIKILTIFFLSINSVFGQNLKVEYDETIPEYIIALWKNKGKLNDSEFNAPELNQIKDLHLYQFEAKFSPKGLQ